VANLLAVERKVCLLETIIKYLSTGLTLTLFMSIKKRKMTSLFLQEVAVKNTRLKTRTLELTKDIWNMSKPGKEMQDI